MGFFLLYLLLSITNPASAARFSYSVCCSEANEAGALFSVDTFSPNLAFPFHGSYDLCFQTFNESIPAAPDVYVTYPYCKANCKKFDFSKGQDPSTWAAPVIQFILPSIIFSMSIPRRTMTLPSVPEKDIGSDWLSLPLGMIVAVYIALDTLAWVAVILMLAGPLMVSGLTEALVDVKLLSLLRQDLQKKPRRILDEYSITRLLVTVVSGNLMLQSDNQRRCPLAEYQYSNPQEEIPAALERKRKADRAPLLLDLMSAQGDFGALVGAPVRPELVGSREAHSFGTESR